MVSWNFYCYKFSPPVVVLYLAVLHMMVWVDRSILSAVLILIKGDKDGGLSLSASEAGSLGSLALVGFVISSSLYAHWT